jgi:hypothetical protein
MESSVFRSLFNQSSHFFTDTTNGRPIDAARQAHAYELSILWGSAKTNPLASDGLRQLKFFSELDYLMDSSKR